MPEFADTPPPMAICFIPVCFTAFFSLSIKILMMVYWMEAQISFKFSVIKFGLFFVSLLNKIEYTRF